MSNDEFTSRRPPARRQEENLPILDALPAGEIAPTSEERTLAVVCHVGGFLTFVMLPLILWLTKKGESRFVCEHAKEALNVQIFLGTLSLLALILVCSGAGVGLANGMTRDEFIPWGLAAGGFFGLIVLYETVLVILASIAGWRGRPYRSPGVFHIIR